MPPLDDRVYDEDHDGNRLRSTRAAWGSTRSSGEVTRDRTAELLARTQEGYRLGEIDLLRLLDTQRTWLAGQRSYRDALLSYYTALVDLERFLDREIVFTSSAGGTGPGTPTP